VRFLQRMGRLVGGRRQRYKGIDSNAIADTELVTLASATVDPDALVSRVFRAAGPASDQLLKILLEKGANPNSTSDNGVPLPHLAANRLVKLKLLVDFGANIDAPNARGWTPVMSLAMDGAYDEALYLVQRGADISYTAPDGSTLLTKLEELRSRSKKILPKSYDSLANAVRSYSRRT
jgi:Ankyrin repeats (3 copies)